MSKLQDSKANSQAKSNRLQVNDFEYRNRRVIFKSSPKKVEVYLARPTSSRIYQSKQPLSFLIRNDQTLTNILSNKSTQNKSLSNQGESRSTIKRPYSASTQSTLANQKESRFPLPKRTSKPSVQCSQSEMKQYTREALENEIKQKMEIITALNQKEEGLKKRIEQEQKIEIQAKEKRLLELKQQEMKNLVHPVKQENEIIDSKTTIDFEQLSDMVKVTNQRLVQLEELLKNKEKNQSLIMQLENQKRKQSECQNSEISKSIQQDTFGSTLENQSLFKLDQEISRHRRATSQQLLKIEDVSQIVYEENQSNEQQWASIVIQKNVRMHQIIQKVRRSKIRSKQIALKFLDLISKYLKQHRDYLHQQVMQDYKRNKAAVIIQKNFRRWMSYQFVKQIKQQQKLIKQEPQKMYQELYQNVTSLEQIQEQIQLENEQNLKAEQQFGGFMDQNQFRARQETQFSLVEIIGNQGKSQETLTQFHEISLREATTIDLPGVIQVETRKNLDSARHLLNAMSIDPEKVELVYSSDGSLRQLSRDLMNDSVIEAQSFQQSKRNLVLSHFLTYRSIPDEIIIKQNLDLNGEENIDELLYQQPDQQLQQKLQFRDRTYIVDIKYYQECNIIQFSEQNNLFKQIKFRHKTAIQNLEQFIRKDLLISLLTKQVSNNQLQVILSVFYIPEMKRIVKNLERIHQSKRYLLTFTLKLKKLQLFADLWIGQYNKNACLKIITLDEDLRVLFQRFYSFRGVSYNKVKRDFDQSKIARNLKFQDPAIILKDDNIDIHTKDFLLETFKEVSINLPYERLPLSVINCEVNLIRKIIILSSKENMIHRAYPIVNLKMQKAKEQLQNIIDRSFLIKKHYVCVIQTYEISQICRLNFIFAKLKEKRIIKALNIVQQGKLIGHLKLFRQLHNLVLQTDSYGNVTSTCKIKGKERKKFFIENFVNLSALITEVHNNVLRLNNEEILAI